MVDDEATGNGALSHYQQMIESITDYEVIRLDEKGVISSWHSGAQRLRQYTAEEIIGQHVAILYAEEDVADGRVEVELATAVENGQYETETMRVRKDGSQFWASVVITPIRDSLRNLQGYVTVTRDLTQRREQELALRSIEQIINSVTDYEIIRLDAEGIVRSWNPGAQKLKQYTADEVIGRHVSIFHLEEDVRAGFVERELAGAAREGRFETEGWRVRKDGSRFWENVVISPIRDDLTGDVVGFVKVARDLSERREQEQLVQRQRDEILELSTPVIQVWDKVLVLPIIGTLDSVRASRLTDSLLERIGRDQAEVAILDISGTPAVDTDIAQHLLKTVEAARLMGTVSILSGVRPETAQAIVHLGIELGALRSRNSLKDALQLALRLVGTPQELAAANQADRVHANA